MQQEKRPEYHWETSEALYELFCILAIWKKTRQLTVKELSEITKKELRLVAEQVRFLEKEKIIISEKKGRSKYIELNESWLKKYFSTTKSIYDEVPTLVKYRSFKQLLEKKPSYVEVAKGTISITLNEMLSPSILTPKIEQLEKENAKLRAELKKLKEKS